MGLPSALAVQPGVSYPAKRAGSTELLPEPLFGGRAKNLARSGPEKLFSPQQGNESSAQPEPALLGLAITQQPLAKENPMSFLDLFRSSNKNTARSANPRGTFRPQLEQLDERLVPSTLSSAISFEANFGWSLRTEHDWYTVDQTNGHVVEFAGTTGAIRYDLGGANVFALSASLDPTTGYNSSEVFALCTTYGSRYGNLNLHDSGGWHWLGGYYTNISATRDGHVYAVNIGGSNISYIGSDGSSIDLGAPNPGTDGNGYAHTIAASIGRYGQNEVFALGGDGAIYVNSGNDPGQWRLVDNHIRFSSLSATVNNTVFALTEISYYMGAYQETENYNFVGKSYYWTHQAISAPYQYCWDLSADVGANGQDEVYVIDPYATLYVYNPGINGGMPTYVDSDVADVVGADDGFYYEVLYSGGNYDAYFRRWNPSNSILYLGSHLS
jgi:hypothetical protein